MPVLIGLWPFFSFKNDIFEAPNWPECQIIKASHVWRTQHREELRELALSMPSETDQSDCLVSPKAPPACRFGSAFCWHIYLSSLCKSEGIMIFCHRHKGSRYADGNL